MNAAASLILLEQLEVHAASQKLTLIAYVVSSRSSMRV
jgi:hypothetical protein